jgi:type IV pilus assembly protein PilQ
MFDQSRGVFILLLTIFVTVNTAEGVDTQPANGNTIAVSATNQVELHVVEAPLSTVLRVLSTESRRNIIASSRVKGTVTADLFGVSFEEALKAILLPNGCDYIEQGKFIYVDTIEAIEGWNEEEEVEPEEPEAVARLFKLDYVTADEVLPMILPLLVKPENAVAMAASEQAGAGGGGESGSGSAGPEMLMVVEVPDRLALIEQVIDQIDVRPKQVMVEATILRAQLNEQNALGIDFNVLGGVDFEMLSSTSPGVTDVSTGNVPQAELNNTNLTVRTDFNSLVPNGGFTFGILKDQIAVFLRALEQVTDVTVLANPKVLTLNRQMGEVIVGRRDGYITTTVTETTATESVEFLETGTQLRFTPFVGDDGYIRMRIHPEDSSGGLSAANLPFKNTTEVTTSIMVRDGHTILIGGLFRESTEARRSQVPVVGNIPLAGPLFRNTDDLTAREEVIILLTVHIVDDKDDAESFAKISEDIEQLRVGMRRGLQPHGRERLAMAHYHWALQHLEKDRFDKALWDARMALHLVPTYTPALKLKAQLADRVLPEPEGSLTRDFIKRQLMGTSFDEDSEVTAKDRP